MQIWFLDFSITQPNVPIIGILLFNSGCNFSQCGTLRFTVLPYRKASCFVNEKNTKALWTNISHTLLLVFNKRSGLHVTGHKLFYVPHLPYISVLLRWYIIYIFSIYVARISKIFSHRDSLYLALHFRGCKT